MNRHKVLLITLMVTLLGMTAFAQVPPPATSPQTPLEQLQLNLQQVAQDPNAPVGRGRGGGRGVGNPDGLGGRGLGVTPNGNNNPANTIVSNGRGLLVSPNSGAWWTNTALMARIGLTDDQRVRIEKAFENHRQSLTSSRESLEREEAQLARLLDGEQLDRASVTAQISKVVLARGDMEKINALMTLEMREVLTRGQWMQLQVQQSVNVSVEATGAGGLGRGGARSGGGGPVIGAPGTRGGRGQQPPTP
jgi:Spy/CpxP family protein refolding chaperone